MGTARAAVRPRLEGERAREVLEVTLGLLTEVGYDRLTLDVVAATARAGKASLYRRWASKAELVADALSTLDGDITAPSTGDLRGDLLTFVGERRLPGAREAQLMCAVGTAMATDADLNRALRERFVEPRLAALRRILQAARERGEVAEGVDLDLVATVLPAVLTFTKMTEGETPAAELAARVVDEILLPAVRPGGRPTPG